MYLNEWIGYVCAGLHAAAPRIIRSFKVSEFYDIAEQAGYVYHQIDRSLCTDGYDLTHTYIHTYIQVGNSVVFGCPLLRTLQFYP